MGNFGTMGVDWEERINFDRMRKERLAKAKKALDESGLAALFVLRTEDARYLTGFRHHLGPAFIVGNVTTVLPRGGDPVVFTHDLDRSHTMPWMRPDQFRPRANFRERAGIIDFCTRVKELMGDLNGETVGIDIYTPLIAQILKEQFPKTEFVDGYEVLLKAKMVKTEDEIECMRIATAITEAGMDAALRILKPGVRECEVLAEAWRTMTALGSEWTQCANIVASGPYTYPYRRYTSDRIIRKGDLVIIDIGGCFNGYWGDFTRTWICGDVLPTKEQIELHQDVYWHLFEACSQAKPGNTNADVVAAAEPYVRDSLGHSSGVNPWEPPFFSRVSHRSPVTLQKNMVINTEPYGGKEGVGGFRLEQNTIVGDPPEIITTYPFEGRLVKEPHPLDKTTGRTSQFYQKFMNEFFKKYNIDREKMGI